MNLFLNVVAISATVLGSTMALPQARRLARHGRVEGVSAPWIGVSAALNLWWIAYALAESIWALLPVSAISVALYATIGVYFVRAASRSALPGLAFGALVLGMAPLPFLLGGGWTTAGLAIGVSYGLQLLPAVITACRTRDLAGVSAGTWTIAWVEAMLWLAYGIGISDIALTAGGATGAVMSSVILVRLAVTGRRPTLKLAALG
jgi:uncharacterized protein with PQ loop repeat